MSLRRASFAVLAVSLLAHAVLLRVADGALPAEFERPPEGPLMLVAVADPEPAPAPPPAPKPAPATKPAPHRPAAAAPKRAAPPPAPVAAEPDPAPAEPAPVEAVPSAPVTVAMADTSMVQGFGAATASDAADLAAADGAADAPAKPAEPPPAQPVLDPRARDISAWPSEGSIVFRVLYGQSGFQVGEARHHWWHRDGHYEMETELRTTGLTALVRNFQYVQKSEGSVGKTGLRPERFSVDQKGRKPEWASFDWAAGQVTIKRRKDQRVAEIHPGDQDVLSLWHQVGIVGAAGLPLELTVVSNKAATPSRLSEIGVETATLPIGRLDTLHLRAQASGNGLTIDLWLARHYGMLPVRIRVVDDDGQVFDQQAIELRLAPPNGRGADDGKTRMVELREEIQPAFLNQ